MCFEFFVYRSLSGQHKIFMHNHQTIFLFAKNAYYKYSNEMLEKPGFVLRSDDPFLEIDSESPLYLV